MSNFTSRHSALLWVALLAVSTLILSACTTPPAPAAPAPKATELPVAANKAMTDTHMMTDTMAMTDTHMMTDTLTMTDTHMMTDTMTMTDTMGGTMKMLSGGKFYKVEVAATGKASLVKTEAGRLEIHLEGFKVKNGPDLHVYLTSRNPVSFKPGVDLPDGVDLGTLQATSGDQVYAVPDGTNLSKVQSVVIWCKSAKVGFVAARLVAAK